ncbi:MAG TPA: endo-1,4-beta-xylanase [Candidatus Hydrogenedentes bacterium]|nr:endo-1,4-beta-xylanase [Candidatus Hydrogenedentota bacterium]HQM50593.1 endo-1,4-beta-xylanase [Candidatus Hydrogenedentota bacterium]
MRFSVIVGATMVFQMTFAAAGAGALEDARARWSNAEMMQRIDAGIERHRKGDMAVQVLDKEGRPVSGAEVTAVQKTHAFLFGANLFVLGQLATPELNAKYERAFTGIFNFASIPFYWKDLEPEPGVPRFAESAPYIWRRPPPDILVAWCKAQEITAKGHPLLWHSINPDWMPKEPEALHAAYITRFEEIARRYGNDVAIWDVVNESLVSDSKYPLYTPDQTYVPWAFEQAHRVFPESSLLMINEVMTVSHRVIGENRYYRQIEALLKQGCGIEGIGFQFHFFTRDVLDKEFLSNPGMGPESLFDVYEAFGKFGLPLYITEITIPGSGPDGPAIQAETVANLYRLWFSVEKMAGITWWNLADNTAYGNENSALGGLADENLDPKPAYQALDRLINHEWKTRFNGVTDAGGRCAFRGFAGNYEISVAVPGGEVRHLAQSLEAGKKNECASIAKQ